jgi:hypothetical protein
MEAAVISVILGIGAGCWAGLRGYSFLNCLVITVIIYLGMYVYFTIYGVPL